jgi:hypothetical protein
MASYNATQPSANWESAEGLAPGLWQRPAALVWNCVRVELLDLTMDVPMPRLPNYRRELSRRREDLVVAAVAATLLDEGRVVEDARRVKEGSARSPDWMMTLDGEPTAVEVTRLLPRSHVQKAEHLVTVVEAGVRSIVTPMITGLGGQAMLGLSYSASSLARRTRAQLEADTRQLASEVRLTLDELGTNSEPVDIPSGVPWVIRADLTLVPGPHDRFHILQGPDEAQQPDLDDFVARVILSKGAQHVGYAVRCILGIDAEFQDSDDLREAFTRSPAAIPWWRAYMVLGSAATLVYQQDASSTR